MWQGYNWEVLTQQCWPSDRKDLGLGYLPELEVHVAVVVRRLCWPIVSAAVLVEMGELVRQLGGEALLLVHGIGEASCVLCLTVYGFCGSVSLVREMKRQERWRRK